MVVGGTTEADGDRAGHLEAMSQQDLGKHGRASIAFKTHQTRESSHRSLLSPAGKNPDAPRRDRASAEIPNGNVSICLGVLPRPDLAWRSSLGSIAWAWPDHCLGNFFLASLSLWFRVTLRSATDGLTLCRPHGHAPSGEAISHSQIYTRPTTWNITHGAIVKARHPVEHLIGRAARTTWAGAQSQSQRPRTAWAAQGSGRVTDSRERHYCRACARCARLAARSARACP